MTRDANDQRSQLFEATSTHPVRRVLISLVYDFVAGRSAEGMVDPGVKIGQGKEDVLRREPLRDGSGQGVTWASGLFGCPS